MVVTMISLVSGWKKRVVELDHGGKNAGFDASGERASLSEPVLRVLSETSMTQIDYSASAYPVRPDLIDVHQQLLDHLSASGTWWSGEERRAIAEEARAARDCALCADRKQALSPFSIEGEHDGPGTLAPGIVDVVHRIVTDPGRLAKSWYDQVVTGPDLDPERYVEIVGVTVFLNALDVFARAIGVDSQTLAVGSTASPNRKRPETARTDAAWVPQIPPAPEGGDEWTGLYADAEFVPQIGRALSLVPAEVRMMQAMSGPHYMPLGHVSNPAHVEPDRVLDRLQLELIASRVSAINECFY